MIFVCIVRDGVVVIPDGETKLLADDNVIVLGGESDLPGIITKIRGEAK